jgi:formyl-CoA transferase
VKGFGEGSPFESNLAFDMIAQAVGGTMSVTGEAGRQPVKPGISLGDTGTGMLMAITILGALYERRTTGQGRRLQVAMQDAMLHYMRTNLSTQRRTGKAVGRAGGKVPGITNAPSGLFPCKPGGSNDWVYIMTSRANPEHWSRLMTLMGREELINDPRYATPADRVKNEKEVDAVITDWTLRHTKYEAMNLVGSVGVPAGAVLDTMELQNDATFVERGIMQTVEHPTLGSYKMPTWPVRVDGKPPLLKRAPELGEHTGGVLVSWLGMTEAEVEKLRAEGAL